MVGPGRHAAGFTARDARTSAGGHGRCVSLRLNRRTTGLSNAHAVTAKTCSLHGQGQTASLSTEIQWLADKMTILEQKSLSTAIIRNIF